MQDFASSAYWNKVYATGQDDSGQEAVEEWHVEGEVMANAVKRLAGDPPVQSEEPKLLNLGCGKSTLWERCVRGKYRYVLFFGNTLVSPRKIVDGSIPTPLPTRLCRLFLSRRLCFKQCLV